VSLTLCLVFLSWLAGTDELSRLCPLCDRPLVLRPSSAPKVRRSREDMSVLRAWALWCLRVIGLLFLIDKVMRLLDWTLLCSFHSTEWGLLPARTVQYFFLSLEHSPAPRTFVSLPRFGRVGSYPSGIIERIYAGEYTRCASNIFILP